jgi:hypothetical protein
MEHVSAAVSRPRDVVLASVLTIVGSVLALMGVFTAQGELRSSRVRGEIETLLQDEQLTPIDISVDTVLNAVEVGLMAASAASVAAIVLAVFVLRRHNPSRIGLTVLGGIAALAVLLSGLPGLAIAIFVAYTTSLLWRAPVRSWFAQGSGGGGASGAGAQSDPGEESSRPPLWGRPETGGYPAGGRPGASDHPASEQPGPYQQDPYQPVQGRPGENQSDESEPGRESVDDQPGPYQQPWPPVSPQQQPHPPPQQPQQQHQQQPGPYHYPPAQGPGYGTHGYPQTYPQGPHGPQQYGYGYPSSAHYGYPSHHDPSRRPPQVVAAHVLTWVGAAFGIVAGIFFVAAAGSQETIDLVMDQLAAPNVDQQTFVMTLRLAGALIALWALAVAVVSVFSWRRANWAAILLTVMGGGYLLMQLVTLIAGQLAVLFTIVWVAAVLVLLWWPASRQWYSTAQFDRSGPGGPYGGSAYPQHPQQPTQTQHPTQQPPKRNKPW